MVKIENYYRKYILELVDIPHFISIADEAIRDRYKRHLRPKVKPHSIGIEVIARLIKDILNINEDIFGSKAYFILSNYIMNVAAAGNRVYKSSLYLSLLWLIDNTKKNTPSDIFIKLAFVYIKEITDNME